MLTDAAFERELTRLRPGLLGYAMRLTKGRSDDAEEVTQAALVRGWERRSTIEAEEAIPSWLHRVAFNIFVDSSKRMANRAIRASECEDFEGLALIEDRYFLGEVGEECAAAIEGLDPIDTRIVSMIDIEGIRPAECAEILGFGVAMVKSRHHRARLRLRERLAHLS